MRSQGEDKVTDGAEALGQSQAAESKAAELLTTNDDGIHHAAPSTRVSSWMLYGFHMCTWARAPRQRTYEGPYQHAAESTDLRGHNGRVKSIRRAPCPEDAHQRTMRRATKAANRKRANTPKVALRFQTCGLNTLKGIINVAQSSPVAAGTGINLHQ